MIEINKLVEILQGIEITSTFDENNVWKEKYGVSFEQARLKEVLDYIEKEKNDIGLKDINGKSIYADSSIVEFDYLVDIENETFQKRIGIFYFEKTFLAYHISFLTGMNKKGGNADNYNAFVMKNFKIIDTIQENKLGLIK